MQKALTHIADEDDPDTEQHLDGYNLKLYVTGSILSLVDSLKFQSQHKRTVCYLFLESLIIILLDSIFLVSILLFTNS